MTSTFYIKTVKMKEAFNDDDREHLLLEHRSDPLKRRFKRLKRLAETNLCLTVPETSGKCHCLVFVFSENSVSSMLPSTPEGFEVSDVKCV